MDLRYIRELVEWLDGHDVVFERGLSDDEIERIELTYSLRFPPDLRKLLQYALPVSERFPDWRGRPASLREAVTWPVSGILREIERHHFWAAAWGTAPDDREEAAGRARELLSAAPLLVPVYAHRYIPADPPRSGNPLFAVVGTDVIYAGCDLASFFATEFGVPCPEWAASIPRSISFWEDLVS
jgi:hypothetical protein